MKRVFLCFNVFFLMLMQSLVAQSFVPITNYHNGISIGIQGTEGSDYIFDRYYFDPLINDCGLCYIKSDVNIELTHNEYNSRIHKQSTIIRGGDFGTIRYKVDKDWHKGLLYADAGNCYPLYPGPFSFEDMEYENGVPVAGTTGFKPGYALTDRENNYSRGMLDEAGNEYHYFTYYDDDSDGWAINDSGDDVVGTPVDTEEAASDGKSMLFCVNPKTPAIWLSAAVSGAQYYTTPAKVWYVPKIHQQTSYVEDNVDINLKNIMNSNSVYYRIDGGSFQQYSSPISSNTLTDGEHTLEFYYDAAYVQTRKIVKNPDHPSKQDVFEDGSTHGYLLWKNEAEFLRFKDRMLNGVWSNGDYYALHYEEYKSRNLTDFSYSGNKGVRNQFASQELMFAMVGVLEGVSGNQKYMEASKVRLMNNPRMHIETIGWETQHSYQASPSHELTYRGYTDDRLLYQNAFTYDLLAAHFRSDQHAGGITPIEDYRLRDMMATTVHETMMYHGAYETWLDTDVNPSSYEYMWITARAEAGAITALTMPGYNTNYYGTAGFDGTPATHVWTPYPDHPESWKDVFLTYTDNTNSAHVSRLNPFPNRTTLFNWFDGSDTEGLIRANGDFADKSGYGTVTNLGHGFEIFYNVMRRKFNITYPKFHQYMQKSLDGTVWCNKKPQFTAYPRGMMANEYFPDLAPQAIDAHFTEDKKYLYQCAPYYFFFHNPDWENAMTCESTEAPSIPENLKGIAALTSVALNWTASTHNDCGVKEYQIKKNGELIATHKDTQYTDTELTSETQYTYSVAAVSLADVVSDFCTPIQVTTLSPEDPVPVTGISVSPASLDLIVGETEGLTESISPDEATDQSVIWSSGNTDVATVDNNGQVTAIAPGNTIITVTTTDGSHSATTTVTVIPASSDLPNIALNKPATADSKYSDDYPASKGVDGDYGNGGRWISASSDYPHWIEIDLQDTYNVSETKFKTGRYSDTYPIHDYQIQYWNGSDWVDALKISGNTEGEVNDVFPAVTTDKIRLYCTAGHDNTIRLFEIEVYGKLAASNVSVAGVSISPVTLSLYEGQSYELSQTVSPENATDKNVTWSSSDETVAGVDSNGLVTALAQGTATITVKTNDGNKTSECEVVIVSGTTTIASNGVHEIVDFYIWPNPVSESSSFSLRGAKLNTLKSIVIYDLTGKTVYQNEIPKRYNVSGEIIINPQLKKGVYIITICSGFSVKQGKLIVK